MGGAGTTGAPAGDGLAVITKRELSTTAKLSVFKSVFVPILIWSLILGNGRECNLNYSRWDICETFTA